MARDKEKQVIGTTYVTECQVSGKVKMKKNNYYYYFLHLSKFETIFKRKVR